MSTVTADFLIVGGGIAGAMLGHRLTREGASVVILEMEDRPGYHSTGRSAAALIESYGPPGVRALTTASVDFYENPPDGFTETPLMRPRGMLLCATAADTDALDDAVAELPTLERIDEAQALRLHNGLRPGVFEGGFAYEASVRDIDVEAIHQGALRSFRRQGGAIHVNAEVTSAVRESGIWRLETKAGGFEAPVIIDAAGAWGDILAQRCGVTPIGLQPKRRSVGVVQVQGGQAPVDPHWPMALSASETWFFKPDGTNLWCSPADATPVDPHDAWPDDMDIAMGIEGMCDATGYEIEKLVGSWAGLRTFTPDGELRIGFDTEVDGFFWLVGQGGYGFQTAPGATEKAASLLLV